MFFPLRKILFIFIFNLSLFSLLMIGIQNSSTRKSVNLIGSETVKLPISFIIGMSFICGSLSANLFNINTED